MTPLITACSVGNWNVVNVLIHCGADINAKDRVSGAYSYNIYFPVTNYLIFGTVWLDSTHGDKLLSS